MRLLRLANQEAGIDTDMPIPFASTKSLSNQTSAVSLTSASQNRQRLLRPEQVLVINADEPIAQASSLMLQHEVDLLPVVDNDNQLVGILTKGDVLRAYSEIL